MITRYTTITEQTLNAIRYPCPFAPTVTYYTDINFITNNLRGSLWQFAVKYVYYDYSHSAWSPISSIPLPEGDEDENGNWVLTESLNNTLRVSVPTGSNLVGEIHIAAKENDELYHLIKVIVKDALTDDVELSGGVYTYNFRNDAEKRAIPDEDIFRLYDDLPKLARHQELISKNIISYAGLTKGYATIDIDASLQYDSEEVRYVGSNNPIPTYITQEDDYYGEPTGYYTMYVDFPDIDYTGLTVTISIEGQGDSSSNDTDWAGVGYQDVVDWYVLDGWTDDGLGSMSQVIFTYSEISAWYEDPSDTNLLKHSSFKTGAVHPFAIAYKDHANRVMMVLQDNTTKVEIPYLIAPHESKVSINWEINHSPPEGAKYYQWLYGKNSTIESFFQTIIQGSGFGTHVISVILDGLYNLKTVVDINAFINAYNTDNTKSIIQPYTWTKGDRIRIKAEGATLNTLAVVAEYLDFEIDSQDGDEITFATGGYDIRDVVWSLVEVYTPKRQTEGVGIYFEFSAVYPIIEENGELYHGGSTRQTDLVPAQGVFSQGDVYARQLFVNVFGESSHYSNFYDSNTLNIGRPMVYDPYQREVELEQIVHGRRYFEDTKINQLFTFYDSDQNVTLSKVFGRINGMRLRGDTLRVYQEKKASSIYIGAAMIKNTDGSEQLVVSDRIFGYTDVGKLDYGTAHPESVVTNSRTVYFFDVYNGVMMRDAVNGMFPISGRITTNEYNMDYKMQAYFKEKARSILANGISGTKVYSTWDDELSMLIVAVMDENEPNNNSILGFHEPTNTWVSFYDWTDEYGNLPDSFGSGEQAFVSWLDGRLFRHNSDNVSRCNFYGDQKGCAVRVVSNAVPNVKKYFNALAIHSNRAWEVPAIEIPADSTYTRGMFSYLNAVWFQLKRGIFYAAFKRNMRTRQDEESVVDLYNGDKLRGYFVEFDLVQTDDTAGEYTELFKVDVELSDK